MRYRKLGRTGLEVSAVSLGGAYVMGKEPERFVENARDVVNRAFELGINYIDTAPLYGQSEKILGQALKGEKRPYHLATKVGFDPKDFDYRRDTVLASIERSLPRLGQERLTIVQVHEVNLAGWERIMDPGGALEGLRAAQKQGFCDFVGITGRAMPLLARLAATGEFDELLVYHDYHPCTQKAAREVLPAASSSNMGVVAATVLAGGLFVDGHATDAQLEQLDEAEREKAPQIISVLREIPGTLPQNSFRYVLGDARVSTVCSGAASVAELEEVAAAADMEPLGPGDLEQPG